MAAMFITPPEQNHTRSANADWMELQALRAADGRSTIGDLIGIFDINADTAGDRVNDDPGATTAIRNRQTNVFRPGTTRNRYEHDFAFSLQ